MNKIFLYFFLLLSREQSLAQAQTILTGYFTDDRSDTIRVVLYDQMLGSAAPGGKTITGIAKKGQFSIPVPLETEIGYVSIFSSQKPNLFLFQQLIKKGDSIHITINTQKLPLDSRYEKRGLIFSGRNSGAFPAKYLADSLAAAMLPKLTPYVLTLEMIQADITVLWQEAYQMFYRSIQRNLKALEQYKDQTDPLVYQVLKADYYYPADRQLMDQLLINWRKSFSLPDSLDRRKKITDCFIAKSPLNQSSSFISDQAKLISKSYLDYLLRWSVLKPLIGKQKIRISSYLEYIPVIEKTAPLFQQKLLAALYYNAIRGSANHPDSLGRYALANISDPQLHRLVASFYEISQKGRDAFSFRLPDTMGNWVSLEQFKGKSVLLDFWYTGCTACTILATHLKEVKDKFKNDSSVVFISISIDKERKKWISSVLSGKYTDDQSINLYTMGEGAQHALINYYQITAYPQLLLIDPKGKLFSASPPRPDAVNGVEDLSRMILESKLN